jgi:hypothetical protein
MVIPFVFWFGWFVVYQARDQAICSAGPTSQEPMMPPSAPKATSAPPVTMQPTRHPIAHAPLSQEAAAKVSMGYSFRVSGLDG